MLLYFDEGNATKVECTLGDIMDSKVIIKFFSDLLYVKGIICLQEYEDILESSSISDLDDIIEKMLSSQYKTKVRAVIKDLN